MVLCIKVQSLCNYLASSYCAFLAASSSSSVLTSSRAFSSADCEPDSCMTRQVIGQVGETHV